jgi:RNA polymerase primary sigma factor
MKMRKKTDLDWSNDEKEDLKELIKFSNRFEVLTTEQERVLAFEFYELKHTLIPMAIKNKLSPELLNILVARYLQLKQEILNHNWKLIFNVAKKPKYQNKGLPAYDRVIHGYEGFMHGLDKYNPHTGFKIGTYCYWWINQKIQRAIGKFGGTIKIAGNVQDIISKIKVVTQLYVNRPDTEGKPTATQISDMIFERYGKRYSPEKIAEYGRLLWDFVSLDAPSSPDESTNLTIIDYIQAPENYQPEIEYEDVERKAKIDSLLEGLTDKERQVIVYKFGLIDHRERKHKEIAKLLEIKQSEVKAIELAALEKLKLIASEDMFI